MKYRVAELRHEDLLLGFAVIKQTPGGPKLDSLAIYDNRDEIQAVVDKHNEAAAIREHWPQPNEPEVQAILNDPEFEPVRYEQVEVIDYENSDIVYDQAEVDDQGNPVINTAASTFVTKLEAQPVRVDGHSRLDAACELVARKRAGLNGTD